MSKFKGIDYYDIDALLSEEERLIRDTVREWVDDNLLPRIKEAYIDRTFPRELIPQMAELGILGANLPEEYGCAGLNNVAYGLIMQELERGDSGIRSFASVQSGLVMYPIHAGRIVHVSHLCLWQRSTEKELVASNGQRQCHRLLRLDGT